MTISFNEIPNTQRVPFAYVEFDNSNAISGAQDQPYKTLLIGQHKTGTKSALTPYRVTSADQAEEFFGAGSMLAHMAEAYFKVNNTTETWAIAVDDDVASVAATGTVTIAGTATKAGAFSLYIKGVVARVPVAVSDTAASIATALAAVINGNSKLPVTASALSGVLTLTSKNKGEACNDIDVRMNYYDEITPEGITSTIVAMSGGTTNPDIDTVIAALDETQYNVLISPYTDASNVAKLETELDNRWGPLTQNDGHAVSAAYGTHAALGTLGDSYNSKHLTIMSASKFPQSSYEVAAALGAVISFEGALDPARPMQTLELTGILPPAQSDRFTAAERNLLLYDGITTNYVDVGGKVRIERVITTYKKNSFGADDVSYLDLNSKLTLSYIRYDWRNSILRKYPRHKLADDGSQASGAVVTPNVIRAEAIAKFIEWEEDKGLVEGLAQFKNDLIVERNASDRNRIDILLPTDIINQLRVSATKIGFLL